MRRSAPDYRPVVWRVALALLLPRHLRHEIVDDLDEEFTLRAGGAAAGRDSVRAARHWYRSQVLRSLSHAVVCRLRGLPRSPAAAGPTAGGGFAHDLRVAARSLRRAPGFAALTLLLLAIGIGASAAAFSVIDAVMLRPLPYTEPDRIVYLYGSGVASENFRVYTTAYRAFGTMALHGVPEADVSTGTTAVRARVMPVSGGFFALLGARAAMGRVLGATDDDPGAPPAAVVTARFAERHFGDTGRALGRTLLVDRQRFTIVGIMPSAFDFRRFADIDVWLPLAHSAARARNVLARLRDGVSVADARADVRRVARLIEPGGDAAGANIDVQTLPDAVVAFSRDRLRLLMAVAALILLVACANVANLFLARNTSRRRELAIRRALGAGWWQIARIVAAEAAILAAAATMLGASISLWAVRALLAIQPIPLPGSELVSVDARTVLFAGAVAIASVVLFGAAPVLALPSGSMLVRSAEDESGRGWGRVRASLVAGQVTAATLLLVATALFIRTYTVLFPSRPGFEWRDRIAMRVELPPDRFPDYAARQAALSESSRTRGSLQAEWSLGRRCSCRTRRRTEPMLRWSSTRRRRSDCRTRCARSSGARFPTRRFAAPNRGTDGPVALARVVADAMAPWRYQAVLTGVFAAVVVLLTAGGLYGTLAVDVARRGRELAVRLALGAQSGTLIAHAVRRGVATVAGGAALGGGIAISLNRVVGSFLYGVSPVDAWSYAAGVAAVVAVGVTACWLPARRIAKIDPVATLRDS